MMDVPTTPVDGLASDLCSLYGRRSSKEVWMKLFVVHLVTIAAFCHVLNLRRERILGSKLALYLLIPSTFLLAHVLAFLLLTAGVLVWIISKRPSRLGESLKRAPRLFLGSAPASDDADEVGHEDVEREPLLKMGGRFLLACAFLTQCCGTVALFVRRQEHKAVTGADMRMLEVACTGILTAIYWMSIIARVPAYVSSILIISDEETTDLDDLMLRLRGYNPDPLQHVWRTRVNRFLGNYYLCVFSLILKLVSVFDTAPPDKTKTGNFSMTLNWTNYLIPFGVKFVGCLFTGVYLLFGLKGEDLYPASNFGRAMIVFLLFTQSQALIVIWYLGGEWYYIGDQLKELEGWPVDKACPLLWSDPAANWIWAIS